MRMRATEAYFKAKEAEIMRMEDPIAGSEVVSATAPIASVAATISVDTPKAECPKEAAIGTEDGILLRCIERYIEEYSDNPNELNTMKHILSEWRGYSFITDNMRKKINDLNKIIVCKQKENKPSTTIYNDGEYYADNSQKQVINKKI